MINEDEQQAGLFFNLALNIDLLFVEQLIKAAVARNRNGRKSGAVLQFAADPLRCDRNRFDFACCNLIPER